MQKFPIILLLLFLFSGCLTDQKEYVLTQVWKRSKTEDNKLKMDLLYTDGKLGTLTIIDKSTYKLDINNDIVELQKYSTYLNQYKINNSRYFMYFHGIIHIINKYSEEEVIYFIKRRNLLIFSNEEYEIVFEEINK